MSNIGEAITTARDQEEQDNQAAKDQQPQADSTATTEQGPEITTPSVARQEATGYTAVEQTGADSTGGTKAVASDQAGLASEPKPDVSDQGYQELLPKLLSYFNNKREELARALGLHRSTVDRWLNGKSRPNNSTILRMRRLAQERRIE